MVMTKNPYWCSSAQSFVTSLHKKPTKAYDDKAVGNGDSKVCPFCLTWTLSAYPSWKEASPWHKVSCTSNSKNERIENCKALDWGYASRKCLGWRNRKLIFLGTNLIEIRSWIMMVVLVAMQVIMMLAQIELLPKKIDKLALLVE